MPKFKATSMNPLPTFEENKAVIEASEPYKKALEALNTVEKEQEAIMFGSEPDTQVYYWKWGDAFTALGYVFFEELEVLEAQQAPEPAMPALKTMPASKNKPLSKNKPTEKAKVLNHVIKSKKRRDLDETIKDALVAKAMMFY